MSDSQVILCAEFTALPGAAEEVDAMVQAYAATVRAEPGNVTFDVYRRADDDNHFVVFEAYHDQSAFERHLGTEDGRAFNDALASRIVEPESVLTFLTRAGHS